MTVTKLLNNEKVGGFTYKVVVKAADLTETTAATAQTIELIDVEVGSIVQSVAAYMKADFSDASDTAFNTTAVTIGDGADVDRFITSTELNVNGTEVDAVVMTNAVNTLPYAYTSADTIDLVVSAMTGKSLVNIDTGELWIFVNVVNLADQ